MKSGGIIQVFSGRFVKGVANSAGSFVVLEIKKGGEGNVSVTEMFVFSVLQFLSHISTTGRCNPYPLLVGMAYISRS